MNEVERENVVDASSDISVENSDSESDDNGSDNYDLPRKERIIAYENETTIK